MSFITPAFLLLGLLAGPIILLYMLRLRRREVRVSSTLLWQKLLRDREANAPWQKLRRNLLLILQLLILAALALALARPFWPTPSLISGNAIVLLDASASMQATDITPSRFAAAQAEVEQLINDLPGSDQMTLIHVGRTPTVLAAATNDRTLLRQVLAQAQPEAGTADWAAALALASGAAQGFRQAQIFVVSDGGLPDELPLLPSEPIYIPIGRSSENLAVTALAARAGVNGLELFASVSNEGTQEQQALLSLTLDGTLFDARRVVVPAGQSHSETWQLPAAANISTIQATLSNKTADFLAVDDTAWAIHADSGRSRTLLVTDGNLFLEQVYNVLPDVEAFKTTPGSPVVQEPFDLYVFDSTYLPNPLPDGDLLVVNPQPDDINGLFTPTVPFSATIPIRLTDSPLLQFVDWRAVHIQQAQGIVAPWAQTVVEAEEGPLLLAGEFNGRRVAILTFDIRSSDLPLQIAFPVLIANITGWLRPGQVVETTKGLQPGDPVTLTPSTRATAVVVQKPDTTSWRTPITSENRAVVFSQTSQPGLYQVLLEESNGTRPAGIFAVNVFNAAESHIAPAETIRIGQTTAEPARKTSIGQREFWPWLLLFALFILLVEWWVHHRGTQLPKITFR